MVAWWNAIDPRRSAQDDPVFRRRFPAHPRARKSIRLFAECPAANEAIAPSAHRHRRSRLTSTIARSGKYCHQFMSARCHPKHQVLVQLNRNEQFRSSHEIPKRSLPMVPLQRLPRAITEETFHRMKPTYVRQGERAPRLKKTTPGFTLFRYHL